MRIAYARSELYVHSFQMAGPIVTKKDILATSDHTYIYIYYIHVIIYLYSCFLKK